MVTGELRALVSRIGPGRTSVLHTVTGTFSEEAFYSHQSSLGHYDGLSIYYYGSCWFEHQESRNHRRLLDEVDSSKFVGYLTVVDSCQFFAHSCFKSGFGLVCCCPVGDSLGSTSAYVS